MKTLKQNLKEIAHDIRAKRAELKEYQRKHDGYDNGYYMALDKLKHEFRHKHIAYCELRGRDRSDIEPFVKEGNEPNEQLIQAIKNQFAETEEIAA